MEIRFTDNFDSDKFKELVLEALLETVNIVGFCSKLQKIDEMVRSLAFLASEKPLAVVVTVSSLSLALLGRAVPLSDHDVAVVWEMQVSGGGRDSRALGRFSTATALGYVLEHGLQDVTIHCRLQF